MKLTDELIEAQKARMTERHADSDVQLTVNHLFLVVDADGGTAHLIVPIHWEGGVYYGSFSRINRTWKIVSGAEGPDKILRQSTIIFDAYHKQADLESSRHPIHQLDQITTKHADPFIQKNQP